jgi:hypothetical protein
MMRGNNTVAFAEAEILKIGSVLQTLIHMIPNEKENKEILRKLVEAEYLNLF